MRVAMLPAEAISCMLHTTAHAACCSYCCLVALLQDVEKLAARKGVVLQSIQEVLQVSCDAAEGPHVCCNTAAALMTPACLGLGA
jgi:hypothetical protein